MYLNQYNLGSNAVNNVIDISLIDKDDQSEFYDIFENLKRKRNIIADNFSENEWGFSDHHDDWSLDFSKISAVPVSFNRETYINALKKIVLGKIHNGKHCEGVITDIKNVIKFGNISNGFQNSIKTQVSSVVERAVYDVMENFQIEPEFVNVKDVSKADQRRTLAATEEYYLFEKRLNEFWETASEEDKIVFFPLYLFWFLCNIIPTRPKEFCLIRSDCICENMGFYYVYLPKSDIKGGHEYVPNDVRTYPRVPFQIPKDIADKILWYKESTKNNMPRDPDVQGRLFNNIELNNRLRIRSKREKFQNRDISFLRDKFYERYAKMHMDFNPSSVEKWRPYDLRHLSLINMVELGIDPMVCMYFAGHRDMSMVLHYAENINSLTKLRIHYAERYTPSKVDSQKISTAISIKEAWVRIPGGVCTNNLGRTDNWQCANYPSDEGCPFFIPDGTRSRTETMREALWKHFCKLILKKNYEKAAKTLIEFQRQTAIYERELRNGQTEEI